jgi:Zn-dependent protease with chaperone function
VTTPRIPRQAPVEGSRLVDGRPGYYPSARAWLGVGIGRNWRGVLGALAGTYLYLPVAILMSVVSAVVLGIIGFIGGLGSSLFRDLTSPVLRLPLVGEVVQAFLLRTSGIAGALLGVLLGLVLGFVGALLFFWWFRFSDDPLAGAGWVLGAAAAGLLVGLVYTLGRVAFEGRLLRLAGARRMSRRERALIEPILGSCVRRLGLTGHPPILIDDSREPNASAHTRHIVVTQGLLAEFGYDREVIAGVLSHQLVHWRNGDPISAAFVTGVALPLYLVYEVLSRVTRGVRSELGTALMFAPLALLGWIAFWPVMVTVKYIVLPLQAADVRRAEFRADRGAVLAGHRDGLRRVLVRLGQSFEAGRSGWRAAVSATVPPSELRLELLEDPSGSYPLPDPDHPAAS